MVALGNGTRPQTSRAGSVSFVDIVRRFGSVCAADRVSLDIASGEFVTLLGPSGSGKTTLLMLLAGFDKPDSGRILISNKDVAHVPANKRSIGMVFQKYALFPHMSVADNIAFPLRMRHVGRCERDEKVRRVLEMVRLSELGNRMPNQLSGGQQQRVAMARALVFDPPVILMDEPLGALDRKLRKQMQVEIKQLQRELGATVIYVTHDQEEALTMSDRIAVLSQGRIVQLGDPDALYHRPENPFVASFLGEMNFIPGEVVRRAGDLCFVQVGMQSVEASIPEGAVIGVGSTVELAIRPERLTLLTNGHNFSNTLRGRVTQKTFNGAYLSMYIELESGSPIRIDVGVQSASAVASSGDLVAVGWRASDARAFAGTGKCLPPP